MGRRYLYASVVLIVLGALVFYFNYERQTVQVTPETDELTLLEYFAPEYDPLPHYVIVEVDTTELVEISYSKNGEAQTVYTDDGSGKYGVLPAETITVTLRNPYKASGTVKTTLYCDSWNYSAYLLVLFGTVSFLMWLRKSDRFAEGFDQ